MPFASAKHLDDEDTDTLAEMCKSYLTLKREGAHPLYIAPYSPEETNPNG